MFADFSPTSKPPTRRKGLTINPFPSNKSGLLDSNQRPRAPQTCALPTALNPVVLWCKGNDYYCNLQILYIFFNVRTSKQRFKTAVTRLFRCYFVHLQYI